MDGKKECPSCAMDIDEKSKKCPVCGYEFPEYKKWVIWLSAILIIIFLFLLLRY